MKSYETVRRIDALGRIVIPKEFRDGLLLSEGSSVEVSMNKDSVILKKRNNAKNLKKSVLQLKGLTDTCSLELGTTRTQEIKGYLDIIKDVLTDKK